MAQGGESGGRALLLVSDMDCASCVRPIEQALQAVPGVAEANVNFAAQNATVACDASITLRP
jgi:P-type Cu+ transporter